MATPVEQFVRSPGTFLGEYRDSAEAFVVYAVGILLYALVVNLFYQHISKRVMFAGTTVDGRARVRGPMHGWAYLTLFPLAGFAFFLLLSLSLLFLGGPNQTTVHVITLSFALVAAVRVAAYVSEPASHDVAKMLPLGLLGVVIARSEFSTLAESVHRMLDLFQHASLVGFFFATVFLLEFGLRTAFLLLLYERPRRDRLPRSFRETARRTACGFPPLP